MPGHRGCEPCSSARPHTRQLNGALNVGARGGIARALVELHADVGAELHGDFHVVLGRPEHVTAVVVVDDKAHALVGELDGVVMAEHLEAARVGKNGAVPVHKLVQAAQLGNGVLAGTHGQVIGVGKHDLGAELFDGLGRNTLDVCLGAHGHKDRRLDIAVRGVQYAGRACVVGSSAIRSNLKRLWSINWNSLVAVHTQTIIRATRKEHRLDRN